MTVEPAQTPSLPLANCRQFHAHYKYWHPPIHTSDITQAQTIKWAALIISAKIATNDLLIHLNSVFVMKPIQCPLHKDFQGFLTNNLNDVTEGLFVLAKRRMLSITLHLNTQLGFHWIQIDQLLNVRFSGKPLFFQVVQPQRWDLRSPMRLQYYPWSPETLCLVTNHTHFSKSEKYIWSYFLITNFICFGHFLNAITANLEISIKENFPFFNDATKRRMCNAQWRHTIGYDWNKFKSRIPLKDFIFILAIVFIP